MQQCATYSIYESLSYLPPQATLIKNKYHETVEERERETDRHTHTHTDTDTGRACGYKGATCMGGGGQCSDGERRTAESPSARSATAMWPVTQQARL